MRKIFPEIKRIISAKDLVAKIICVLLAVILWAYISNTNIGEMKFKIPITFINLSEILIKSKVSNRYVTITLVGRKDILKNVNIKNIKAEVNLEQPEIGINKKYPIEINKDEIPENIEVKLSNKEVNLIIERKIYKKVKVKTSIIDKVMEGYVLGRIKIIPDSIIINGPESLIKSIDFVQTKNISLRNRTGRIIRELPIDKKNLLGINMDISRVRVIIPVLVSANLFKFKKKIILRNKNDKYKYILSQEEVNVYLQSDNADIIPSEDDFEVFINVGLNLGEFFNKGNEEDYIEKNYSIDVTIKKEGIRVISLLPDIISVKIFEK